MTSRLRNRKFVALALLLALPLAVLWPLPSRPPPLRVSFQHATNDPGNGRVGVVELVNNLNETVDVMGGWYVPAKRKDLSVSKDTPGALIYGDVSQLTARSTNMVQVSMPTNGGPYRLVFQCVPDRTSPPRMAGTLRYRFAGWVSPWLHPSQATLVRWFGAFFAASQAIDVGP